VQIIAPPMVPVRRIDLSALDAAARAGGWPTFWRGSACGLICCLAADGLTLIGLPGYRLVSNHHLSMDGWSPVLVQEL
jgi:hypothetical protein